MKKRIILIIDDDQDDRSLFSDAVAEVDDSITCIHASDGIEGVEKLKCGNPLLPDFIFLDLNMPRLNGVKCLEEIKKDPRLLKVPVIIYSTSRRTQDMHETKELGAAYFLTKPVLFKDICSAISSVLSKNEKIIPH
jgi:CheY-like chemotaxis protein